MKAKNIKKVLILDQGNPVAGQLLQKATEVFGTDGVQYVVLKAHRTHNLVLTMMEETIREETPELVLLGATALGEEVAPALGVRLGTGVAAHCVDIKANEEGRLTFMIPAIGGRAVGEIFIPEAEAGRPAIATVKPGIFPQPADIFFRRNFSSSAALLRIRRDLSLLFSAAQRFRTRSALSPTLLISATLLSSAAVWHIPS